MLAEELLGFLAERYNEAFPPVAQPQPLPEIPPADPAAADDRPYLGVVVGGYSSTAFHPEEYLLSLPRREIVATRQADTEWGVMWWGQTESLQRLLHGVDPRMIEYLRENGVDPAAVDEIYRQMVSRFSWGMVFDGMPLQDAIDLAVFLANIPIGQSRFVIGPPVCGGHVDVATISHRGFTWVRQKANRVKIDSAFF